MPTSPKKSKPAQRKRAKSKKLGGFGGFDTTVETPADQQIAALQNELATQKDQRLEERFAWIFLSSLLGLMIAFSIIPVAGMFVVTLLYLGALIVCARRCGVDDVVVVLSAIWALITRDKNDD